MRGPWIVFYLLSGCGIGYELAPQDELPIDQDEHDEPDHEDTDEDDPGDNENGSAHVTGRICNTANDRYVVGATATITVGEQRFEDITDEDGYFRLSGIPLGTHDIAIQKNSFSTTVTVLLDEAGETVELDEPECLDPDSVTIAVVSGEYDHIETILDELELEYRLFNGQTDSYIGNLLLDPDALSHYDIIFFNCGMSEHWMLHASDVTDNLYEYMENGGSIYASDWAYFLFEATLPTAADFYGDDVIQRNAARGVAGQFDAHILDANFQATVGSDHATLTFNLPEWVVRIDVAL